MKYLLVSADDQIPKCVTVGCQDIMTNMDGYIVLLVISLDARLPTSSLILSH
jgi:hypothetical protein